MKQNEFFSYSEREALRKDERESDGDILVREKKERKYYFCSFPNLTEGNAKGSALRLCLFNSLVLPSFPPCALPPKVHK